MSWPSQCYYCKETRTKGRRIEAKLKVVEEELKRVQKCMLNGAAEHRIKKLIEFLEAVMEE